MCVCEVQALQVVFVFAVFAVKQREKYRERGWGREKVVHNGWSDKCMENRESETERQREREGEGGVRERGGERKQ